MTLFILPCPSICLQVCRIFFKISMEVPCIKNGRLFSSYYLITWILNWLSEIWQTFCPVQLRIVYAKQFYFMSHPPNHSTCFLISPNASKDYVLIYLHQRHVSSFSLTSFRIIANTTVTIRTKTGWQMRTWIIWKIHNSLPIVNDHPNSVTLSFKISSKVYENVKVNVLFAIENTRTSTF